MKVSIKLPKKLISVWKKELINKTECYKATGVNRQTINKAIKDGKCAPVTMYKINEYIISERAKAKRKLKKILSHDLRTA